MITIKSYKSGFKIKQDSKLIYWVYEGKKKRTDIDCGGLKDARFFIWCLTH